MKRRLQSAFGWRVLGFSTHDGHQTRLQYSPIALLAGSVLGDSTVEALQPTTDDAYLYWVGFFVRCHERNGQTRHPSKSGATEVEQF